VVDRSHAVCDVWSTHSVVDYGDVLYMAFRFWEAHMLTPKQVQEIRERVGTIKKSRLPK
jgi:hypothetical protein